MSYFFFPLSVTFFIFMSTLFDAISSDIDMVLWIKPSPNEFVFGDFNVLYKARLTYSGDTDRLGEFCYKFYNFYNYLKWPYSYG